MEKIKLMLADDHNLFLDGLGSILGQNPEFDIAVTANDGEEVLMKLKSYYIDILLLDIQMPKMNGIETAREVSSKYPDTKIIVLTSHNEKAFIQKMYQNGVYGYLLKTCNKAELYNAIQLVYKGGKYFSTEIAVELLESNTNKKTKGIIIEDQLSKREKEILVLIAKEYNNNSISEQLHISIHTVNTHRKNLLLKLGMKNTAGLVNYAINKGLMN